MKKYINISDDNLAQALLDIGLIKRDPETSQLFVGEIKFTALPTGNAIVDADIAPWVQSGINVKQPASAVKTYLQNSGNFLLSANNLSDVSSITSSAQNLGVRNGYVIYSDDLPTILPNPLPRFIGIGHTSSQTFKFPDKATLNVNAIADIYFINNYSSFDQTFLDSNGDTVFIVKSKSNYIYTPPDILSPNWYAFPVPDNLQQIYDASTLKQIKFGAGSGLAFLNSINDNLFVISDVATACFEPFVVSANGTDGMSVIQTTDPNSTFFEIQSTTLGSISEPVMTETQRNAIDVTNNPIGVGIFNLTTKTRDYYDGTTWQKLLTTQNVNGTGTVTVTDNGDGTIDIFGSGGSPVPNPSFASYSVINNNAPRPAVAGSFTAVPVSSGFTDISDQNFTSQTMTIAGINTVGSTYTGTETSNFVVNQSCVLRPTSNLFREYYFAIAILRSGGSIETTNYQAYANTSSNLVSSPASMNGIVQLSTGDTVFTQIYSSASDANAATYTITSEICIAAGAIPNTDSLSQGSNNFYLSQNGGTTYENISGSLTIGNLVSANTTGGQLIDSGLVAANVILSTGSYSDPTWITSLNANKLSGAFTGYSGGNTALTGVNAALTFGSALSDGNYLQLPNGNNIGQYSFGGFPNLFLTYNLTYDATASSYKYVNSGQNGFAIELTPTGIFWKYAGSGTAGSTVVPTTGMYINSAGIFNIQSLTASSMVVTDSGKNLVSSPLPLGPNAIVTISSSTQSMDLQTRYIVTYGGGQMAATLPAATGTGKTIEIIGLVGASTSGWKVTANGSDTIQFNSTVSAGGGNVVSTAGSATDAATFIDAASGKWIIYPAGGLNLVVT